MANPTNLSSSIRYQRIRVPREHGATLQIPKLKNVASLWADNLGRVTAASDLPLNFEFATDKSLPKHLFDWQFAARQEVIELAKFYTRQYRALPEETGCSVGNDDCLPRVVMTGHQPELFHPGVWYKNFVLSRLGESQQAVAINLVVDSDLSGNDSVRFPKTSADDATFQVGTIPIDRPAPSIPFEQRDVVDWSYFCEFPDRVSKAMGAGKNRIVDQLWPHVARVSEALSDSSIRLGAVLAAGRHCLEGEIGLKSLELPISRLAGTEAFATFACHVITDVQRFQEIYNRVLADYRIVHGIRSTSHPVPSLVSKQGWMESPFWVWHRDRPRRHGLYVQLVKDSIMLSDLEGWEVELRRDRLLEDFQALATDGVFIRSRALTTTMFCRLLLSDLFLHGVGGAKYDQLTDAIAMEFFQVFLPAYLTLSATLQLPSNYPVVSRSDVTEIKVQRREMEFHPETFLGDHEPAAELILEKRHWISGANTDVRSQEKHRAIVELNRQMRAMISTTDESLKQQRDDLRSRLRNSEIVSSREYSYCLFETEAIVALKAMASVP